MLLRKASSCRRDSTSDAKPVSPMYNFSETGKTYTMARHNIIVECCEYEMLLKRATHLLKIHRHCLSLGSKTQIAEDRA